MDNSTTEKVALLHRIDFGSIDGLYDKNLSKYFLDDNYWNKIIYGKVFYVIGRKGTGKSAIYSWLKDQQLTADVLIQNSSFKSFPFERLLRLSDDDYSAPNQYQSIWRNIILSEIAGLIVQDQKNPIDDDLSELKNYIDYRFGSDLTDLYKKVATSTQKTETGLEAFSLKFVNMNENKYEFLDGFKNITEINRRLEQIVISYLKRHQTSRYILQFDQLDDNYTSYTKTNSYFQSIISLFKVIYDINLTFEKLSIPVKTIAYLRSDIFYEINAFDPESSRWDSYKFHLNWSIINKSDWYNPALLKLINRRIDYSIPELTTTSPFHYLFNDYELDLRSNNVRQKPFKFLIHRTFHRPRDVVQFCIKIQDEVKKSNKLDFRTFSNAEKEYSTWLLSELANEMSSQISSTKTLFAFLRQLGSNPIVFDKFRQQFLSGSNRNINKSPEALVRYLYRLGIIMNVNTNGVHKEYFSIIRNEQTEVDLKMQLVLNSGLLKGLHTFSTSE